MVKSCLDLAIDTRCNVAGLIGAPKFIKCLLDDL
jgi:hypothetical protein